ncbi:hypothetical protein FZEAL_4647 [Fusarium zealandicum]|uniref:Uncharacterized protein n=1 Tax=Fusarium zealandicum TaxID=1053134 RepID=A0A8H4UM15_9HYPO|nr:hypothetical protein FZEAL_4647 [Fusarium zealandicum]
MQGPDTRGIATSRPLMEKHATPTKYYILPVPKQKQNYARPISSIQFSQPPENAYLYESRPLPPPPASKKSTPRAKPPPTRRFSAFPKITGPGNNPVELPQRPPVVVPLALSKRRAARMSVLGTSTLRDRRSSQKIQQLTGHDIGGALDWTSPPNRHDFSRAVSPKLIQDDSSSGYSVSIDDPIFDMEPPLEHGDYQPRSSESSMPPLEPDCDSVLSSKSYTAPSSPKPIQRAASLRVAKTRRFSTATGSLDPVPDLSDPFDEDVSWQDSTSHNFFSDVETADEYHRITTRLANNDKRQSIYDTTSVMSRSQTLLTRRLSVSAKSLFSRKKDIPISSSSSRISLTASNQPTKGPYSPSIPPPPSDAVSMISLPRSIFETDDEEELDMDDGSVGEVINHFFARRSEERTSAEMKVPRSVPAYLDRPEQRGLFEKTGGQFRGLFTSARDGAKMIQAARVKRRTQLGTQIKMIPEEETGR